MQDKLTLLRTIEADKTTLWNNMNYEFLLRIAEENKIQIEFLDFFLKNYINSSDFKNVYSKAKELNVNPGYFAMFLSQVFKISTAEAITFLKDNM